MPDYPQHDKVLAYMRHQVDIVHEVPNGSNRGPLQVTGPHLRGGVDFYQTHDFLAGNGYPWCVDAWLTGWAEGAGRTLPYLSAGAYDMLAWAKRVGWFKASADCVPGDGLVFKVGAGHLATLEKQLGDNVQTIDGNHGDKVARAIRPRSLCLGGIHVPEDGKPDPPAPKPYYVIATSMNGHRKLVFSKFATDKVVLGMLPRLLAKYGPGGITIARSKPKSAGSKGGG